MSGQRIGYVRVSSFDQNSERQLEQVLVDEIFTDQASGKDTQRPELERLLAFVPEGERHCEFWRNPQRTSDEHRCRHEPFGT